jgi:hypothetical protein
MLGNTLTVTYGGSGGTAVVCPSVNGTPAPYASEYWLKGSTYSTRARVRSTKGAISKGVQQPDRHNIRFEQALPPSDGFPNGRLRTCDLTITTDPNDDMDEVVKIGQAMTFYATSTILGKVLGFES